MTVATVADPRRVAVLSVHTSPLDQPGTGDGGGLNVYVLEVCRRLAARGIDVDVYTRAVSAAAPPAVEVTAGLTVRHVVAGPAAPVPKQELPNLLCAFLLAVDTYVDDHRLARSYDVVHAHYWLAGWVGRRLRRRWGVPLVQSFHTLARVKNAALAPGEDPEPGLRLIAEARILEDADRIVVPVCDEARLLHRSYGLPGTRLVVVPPGVDLTVFHPGSSSALAEAPPGQGPLLLFVGRLQPLKAPDVAVRTLALVRRAIPDVRLLVVGGTSGNGRGRSGPTELATLARRLGVAEAVTFAPARPQSALANLYRAADCVVVPSRTESFGLVALEAQACGTPVVAANVGGLRAVVRGGGTLVAGHDPADHAAAVVAYLADPVRRARATAAGLRTAAASSWERTVAGLVAVYGEVAARRPAVHEAGA